MVEKTVKITDKAGVHARPAAKLLQLASSFNETVTLSYLDKTIDFKSILGLMSLAIPYQAEVTLRVEGENEEEVLEKLIQGMKDLGLA